MGENENEHEHIDIDYNFIKSEDHKTFVTNRAWGGFTDGGLFELNFILEHKEVPSSVKERHYKSGEKKELSRNENNKMTRKNEATAYMTLQSLLSMYEWMGQKIKELEDQGVVKRSDNE